MICHLIFILAFIIAIIVNICYYRRVGAIITFKQLLVSLLLLCLFAPVVEESFYRYFLRIYLQNIPYNNLIIITLFSSSHLLNLQYLSNLKVVSVQVLLCIYLGWYLLWLDNINHSIIIHCLYNSGILFSTYLCLLLLPNKPIETKVKDDSTKKYTLLTRRNSWSHKSNIIRLFPCCKVIDINKLPLDLQLSFDKYEQICLRHATDKLFKLKANSQLS